MDALVLHHRDEHDCVIISVDGDLDADTSYAHHDEFLALCGRGGAVVVDLARVRSCDPVAVALLVNGQQCAHRAGGQFVLAAPSFAVAKTLRVTGLAGGFTTTVTVGRARAALTSRLAEHAGDAA